MLEEHVILHRIFHPQTVAIVGASRAEKSMSHTILGNMRREGFKGNVYPVNPKAQDILDYRCYPSILDIREEIDLAGIFVPWQAVLSVVRECVQKGVGGIVVITAGFGELGVRGKELEEQLKCILEGSTTRLIGPNCNGLFSPAANLNFTPMRDVPRVWNGGISLVFQSGNLSTSAVEYALRRKIGLNKFVNVGNQVDVSIIEVAHYLKDDPTTDVIAIYMEELKDGSQFLKLAKEITLSKPIVVLKAGKSKAGARAVSSHTGALAGNIAAIEAAFKQTGVLSVESLDDLLYVAYALAECPPLKTNQIAIFGDGGGHVSLASDAADRHGLTVPVFAESTQHALSEVLNPLASKANPVDIVNYEAKLDIYSETAKVCLGDTETAGLVMVGLFGGIWDPTKGRPPSKESSTYAEVAMNIARSVKSTHKPMVVHSDFAGAENEALDVLRTHGIPVYGSLNGAIKAMSMLYAYSEARERLLKESAPPTEKTCPVPNRASRVTHLIEQFRSANPDRSVLSPNEANTVLQEYEIPVPCYRLEHSKEEAVRAARLIGYPAVMKIVSPRIVHKTDVGGVALNLRDDKSVALAYDQMMREVQAKISQEKTKHVLIMPYYEGAREVVVGMVRDPCFGPVIMFGLGGVYVELLRDVAFGIAPLAADNAVNLMKEVKTYPLLCGFRGGPSSNIEELASIVVKVSLLAIEVPQIQEIDLNPVLAFENATFCVDARIVLANSRGGFSETRSFS